MNRPFLSLHRLAGLAACLVLLGGCSVVVDGGRGPIEVFVDEEGNTDTVAMPAAGEDCYANSTGSCVLASGDCSADDIYEGPGGTTCATCDGREGPVEICGAAVTTNCTQRVDAFGQPCQRCEAGGELLYDDCRNDQAAAGEDGVFCERLADGAAPAQGSDDEPGSIVVDGEEDCEVCYDAFGSVVRTQCRPQSDECFDVEIDGRSCLECTLGGELAYRECEPVDLDPQTCAVYENEVGRCVDCFIEDTLISHACILDMGDPNRTAFCTTTATFDGQLCTECFDEMGNLVEAFCEDDLQPDFCEVLELPEANQVCTMCLDAAGQLASSECYELSCLERTGDPLACISTVPCTVVMGNEGELCRECPIFDDNGQQAGFEQACLNDDLQCEFYTEYVETPPDPMDPNLPGDAVVVEVQCRRCFEPDGTLAYEQCGDPPDCYVEPSPNGDCLVCVDPLSGDEIYDCGEPTNCWEEHYGNEICWVCEQPDGTVYTDWCEPVDETCWYEWDRPIFRENGDPLLLPPDVNLGVASEAFLQCQACDDLTTPDGPDVAGCMLNVPCADDGTDPGGNGGNGGSGGGPGNPPPDEGGDNEPGGAPPPDEGDAFVPEPEVCLDAVFFQLPAPKCQAPWGDNVGAGIDEVAAVFRWLMVEHEVVPYTVAIGADPFTAETCEACDCNRGDTVLVSVSSLGNDIETLIDLGFDDAGPSINP